MDKTLGQVAFEAYNKSKGGKTWDGKPIPPWTAVGDDVRVAWECAATDAITYFLAEEEKIEAEEQVPSIGRIVHFVMDDGQHRPAIIVQVFAGEQGEVGLVVFEPATNPTNYLALIGFDPQGEVGSWHWPEYVPAK